MMKETMAKLIEENGDFYVEIYNDDGTITKTLVNNNSVDVYDDKTKSLYKSDNDIISIDSKMYKIMTNDLPTVIPKNPSVTKVTENYGDFEEVVDFTYDEYGRIIKAEDHYEDYCIQHTIQYDDKSKTILVINYNNNIISSFCSYIIIDGIISNYSLYSDDNFVVCKLYDNITGKQLSHKEITCRGEIVEDLSYEHNEFGDLIKDCDNLNNHIRTFKYE